jgi:hypothetical protein
MTDQVSPIVSTIRRAIEAGRGMAEKKSPIGEFLSAAFLD